MKTFSELKSFAERMIRLTNESGYPCEIYMCSSKIGKPVKVNEFGHFNMQTKYIVVYPKSALDEIEIILDGFAPSMGYQRGKDLRSKNNRYGIDVYTNVESIHPKMEPQVSSPKYNESELKQDVPRWLRQQQKQFIRNFPHASEQEIEDMLNVVRQHFRQMVLYLRSKNEPNAQIKVIRSSGVKHTILIKPNTKTKRTTYSNLLIAIGDGIALPKVLNKNVANSRKPRAGSNRDKYQRDPNAFKYYDQFGIFEVFDLV